jgi:hypothetical protein
MPALTGSVVLAAPVETSGSRKHSRRLTIVQLPQPSGDGVLLSQSVASQSLFVLQPTNGRPLP